MIRGYRIGNRLQQHCLSRPRRRDNQSTLALSNRSDQIQYATRNVVRRRLQTQPLLRIQGSQIVEEDSVSRVLRRLKIDRFDFKERKILFIVVRQTNLA